MRGPDVRAAWLRGQVVLVLSRPGTRRLIRAADVDRRRARRSHPRLRDGHPPRLDPGRAPVALVGERLRVWARAQIEIRRAEAPNRAGRPHPRAPGAGSAAPVC